MTDKKLSPRDVFECEYIARHMSNYIYQEAKHGIQANRFELTYIDEHLASAFVNWIEGMDWSSENE